MAVTDSYTAEDEMIPLGDDIEIVEGEEAEQEETGNPVETAQRMQAILDIANIASQLDDNKLSEISSRVIAEYELDDGSRSTWKDRVADALKLAMLVGEQKDYPFEKASNVKYPLVTVAALQFHARAYPAIVPGDRVARCKVNGRDPDGTKAEKGERISEYTSYQLLTEMPEWDEDTDRLLLMLPIAGSVFRKKYFDAALNRQVSRLVTADRLVVNYWAQSLITAPRISEEIYLYPYEIQERIRSGRFVEFEYGTASAGENDKESDGGDDPDRPHLFIEQHRRWDLDEDGYAEPYVVTVHKSTGKVCRIVGNYTMEDVRINESNGQVISIQPQTFYAKYDLLPNPEGGFYGLGFGWLLKDNNEAINAALNMLLDAGHLSNIQGGLISSALGIKEKSIRIKMGEWRVIQSAGPINQAIMPITYPGPSETLFKLLGFLIEMGKEVANVKDVLTGETGGKVMQPTTVLALIEQGLQAFTAIYKRTHRALKGELAIHARLNKQHLDAETYNAFFDDGSQYDPKEDFDLKGMDITPVSDPKESSKMTKLAKAEFLKGWATDNPMANLPEVNLRILEAADIEDREKLINQPQPPDPEMEKMMKAAADAETEDKLASAAQKFTAALKNMADAEAAGVETNLASLRLELDAILAEMTGEQAAAQTGPGGLSAMEGAPGNAGSAPTPPGAPVADTGLGPVPPMGADAEQSGGVGGPAI